jgi:hypothetical protein
MQFSVCPFAAGRPALLRSYQEIFTLFLPYLNLRRLWLYAHILLNSLRDLFVEAVDRLLMPSLCGMLLALSQPNERIYLS